MRRNALAKGSLVSLSALFSMFAMILVPWPILARASQEDKEATRILRRVKDRLGRIQSIQYQSTIESEGPARKKPNEKIKITYENRFVLDHDKYFSELSIYNPELPAPVETQQAFNGTEHQRLDVGRSSLITGKEGDGYRYQGPQPFMLPFIAMLVDKIIEVRVFGDILKDPLWEDLIAGSRVVGEEKVGSIDCVVIESRDAKGNGTVRMFLARELDYYPLKVDADHQHRKVLCTIDAYEKFVEEDQTLVVPTKVTEVARSSDVPWSTRTTFTVVAGTLEVNQPIREAVFTIPKDHAETYFDSANDQWYRNGKLLVAQEEDRVVPVEQPGLGGPILIGSAALIVIGLSIRAWQRRRVSDPA